MADNLEKALPELVLRIYADNEGKVYLLYEEANKQVEVRRPVSRSSLAEAHHRLQSASNQEAVVRPEKEEGVNEKCAQANREIEAVLPVRKRSHLARAGRAILALFAILLLLGFGYVIYLFVHYSNENWPQWLHLVGLSAIVVGLACLVYRIATEENRLSSLTWIRQWFGPWGLLALPLLILVIATIVFASFTFTMHQQGRVILEPCAGPPVSENSLVDFYLWHFFKLVPLLQINETLKWREPLCYSQARIGFLILLFQGFVVLPAINTIRFYWKTRQTGNRGYVEYVYDPGWTPTAGVAK